MSKHDKKFMCRPGFVDSLLKWKSRPQQQNLMLDVYDGNVWKQFGSVNGGLPFVQQSDYNIMLTINMDWFQPFVGTQHSSGGIYSRSQNCCKELQNSGFTAGCPWVLHQTISNLDCLYLNRKCIYSSIIGYGQWLLVEFEIAKGSIMNIRHFFTCSHMF
ncbi:hypothetical protein RO3G_04208 [Rhizopus delemar RA 99-880]|uniref:Uncharacterized protein n=1 Tax=Rhizopus delemar (strain RA 99-880 / ATCC MYA-4621 / FGSC 9543 / NRRL 43880) TaxID=246409 RepID=I1BTH3_RHIO9|nr:hypothetical protein RO3G_04208 [Rhizopus delemar RA 99-880]|eukprot:EIE79503.1 hypothetical protein RO3G_04208 [Rhizopus delemar RA 99-880]